VPFEPSYHRILAKHGLIEKTLSIPDAYEEYCVIYVQGVIADDLS